MGRNFRQEEDRPNARKVALLSYALWRSRFGGNPGVLGKTIHVDGIDTDIIGVLRPDFEFPNLAHVDLLVPQAVALTHYRRGETGRPLRVFGRLGRRVSAAEARSMVEAYLMEGWRGTFSPEQLGEVHTVVRSLRDYQVQDVRLASWLLFGAVTGVLLIVCANVANLLMARSHGRRTELAVRAALGASRARLMQQTLTECLLLSGFGTALGCALAWGLMRLFKIIAPLSVPRLQQAGLDVRLLLAMGAAMVICALLFGAPAALAVPDAEMLATGGRAGGVRRGGARQLLMMGQVAISVVLLSVAALLVRSLSKLQSVSPGVAVDRVITADITVAANRYANAMARQQFFDRLAERLGRLPGIAAAAISDTVPPGGSVHTRPLDFFEVSGAPAKGSQAAGIVAWRSVSADYFRALSIPIVRGRGFERKDESGPENVVIVSESLARRLFPHEQAIGKTFRLNQRSPVFTVVGVAADVKNNGLARPADPEYYVPRKELTDPNVGRDVSMTTRSLHAYDGEAFLIVRSAAAPAAVANWIRAQTAAMDGTVPVSISTMAGRVRGLSERPRFTAALLSLFASVALALAAAGLYGLISFLTVQRTREAGIRMTVGATPLDIVRLVVRQALVWTMWGVGVGVAGSTTTVRLLRGLFFHVEEENPLILGSMAALMILVATGAALIPAVRAARIDPVSALRNE